MFDLFQSSRKKRQLPYVCFRDPAIVHSRKRKRPATQPRLKSKAERLLTTTEKKAVMRKVSSTATKLITSGRSSQKKIRRHLSFD